MAQWLDSLNLRTIYEPICNVFIQGEYRIIWKIKLRRCWKDQAVLEELIKRVGLDCSRTYINNTAAYLELLYPTNKFPIASIDDNLEKLDKVCKFFGAYYKKIELNEVCLKSDDVTAERIFRSFNKRFLSESKAKISYASAVIGSLFPSLKV